MDTRARLFAARPHLVLPCRRDPSGRDGPTVDETRGPNWRRTSWAHYVPSAVEPTPEQLVLEASVVTPAHGAITGWAGLHWESRSAWFDGRGSDGTQLPVHIAAGGEDVRSQAGIHVCAERLDPADVIVVDGIRVTTSVRSTCYEMRYSPDVRRAAIWLSMAAYSDLVSVDEAAEYAARHSGWIGIPQCRAAIPLAEENCWSPPEVSTVLVWRIDAELPRPLCNRPVFDLFGAHVGTPDLIDVEAGVVGQYEGSVHLENVQRDTDLRAEEAYRRVGLEYFTVRRSDLRDPVRLAERMLDTRGRAKWAAEARRAWTVDYPSWWTPTHSVELRRQLTSDQRRRFLRYRAA